MLCCMYKTKKSEATTISVEIGRREEEEEEKKE